MSIPMVYSVIFAMSYSCHAWRKHAYPFRPRVKTAAPFHGLKANHCRATDQTLARPLATKRVTIRPPPLPAINGVAGSSSFIAKELREVIRQGFQATTWRDMTARLAPFQGG
jgi:hypothetical protein